MSYLLDSDVVIYHLGGIADAISLISRLAPDGIAISIVTYMEVYQSILRAPDPEVAEAKYSEFLSAVPIMPFQISTARRCAELREQLLREQL